MRYTAFTIQNFKGIKKLTLDLSATPSSRAHALVGLNESGKTTILEAIDFFKYGSESLDPSDIGGIVETDVHELIPISLRANFNGEVSVTAQVALDPSDEKELAAYCRNDLQVSLDRSIGKVSITEHHLFENSRFTKRSNTWNVEIWGRTGQQRVSRRITAADPKWALLAGWIRDRLPKIWYFPNFLFAFPDRVYLANPPENDKLHQFYQLILQDILDSLELEVNLQDHVISRMLSGDEIDKQNLEGLLLQMGRSVTDRVFSAWNEILRQSAPRRELQLTWGREGESSPYVQFRIQDADGYFSVSQRSLGFKWFFVYLLMTSYRGSRRNSPPNMLFLFDEPASNLHSSAQTQLLKSFDSLMSRCCIIYTTHSQYLINPGWLENTWVVRNLGLDYTKDPSDFNARKTNITAERYRSFVSAHPDQTSYFQPILDVLEYKPSLLENVPNVVMLEGKSDFYTLKYVKEILLESAETFALMPGVGAGGLDTVIRLYLAWARPFVVLLDSDSEGDKQSDRYKESFGLLLDNRIFGLGDAVAAWKKSAIEDLFEPDDRLIIQKAVFPDGSAYKKKQFHRAIQELLIRKQAVSISAASLGRFRQLCQFLEGHLVP